MSGEALDSIHQYAHQGLAAEGHCAGELHVMWAIPGPARVDADAVGQARHLMNVLLDAETIST